MAIETGATPTFRIQRASERAHYNHGWLKTAHSFAFADYVDTNNLNWGALRVFNDDRVAAGTGFGTHPHRDMEIVTYVLHGELEHKDSLGNHGVVAPGGIQYMSAGTGVTHSEFNHSKTSEIHFVQMWVLPRSYGEPPAYGQAQYTQDDRTNRWLTVASGQDGVPSPTALRQNASLHVARIENVDLVYTYEPGRLGFLFVAVGDVSANGQRLGAGDAVRIAATPTLELHGAGEVILWDIPPTDVRLEDA